MKKGISQLSDKELYTLLKQNDDDKEKAFAELYSRYSRGVYAYCYRIIGNQQSAEDIFQETFLSFLKTTEQKRVMTNVQAFLLRIARNLCLNVNREKRSRVLSLDDLNIGIEDNRIERNEISKLIVSALDLLTQEYREVVVLQLYNEMSYKEIADLLELSISTVRNRATRGKQKIREILAPYFEIKRVK